MLHKTLQRASIPGAAQYLYETVYCERGQAENLIFDGGGSAGCGSAWLRRDPNCNRRVALFSEKAEDSCPLLSVAVRQV